jgi:hypothetical protein
MTVTAHGSAAQGLHEAEAGARLARRADIWFFVGCLLCGTWVLGPIGAPMIGYGMWLMRKAQLARHPIRPWSVTVIGGLVLVDSAVNMLAWAFDLLPAHDTLIGRTLWVDYGLLLDGGYALFHNTTGPGGVAVDGEKAIAFASILMVFPLRIAAAWGLLNMKRWGLQWTIMGNWLYLCLWIIYAANMSLDYPLRFGTSDFGVLGFWLFAGIPFCGPVVMLPYLHTVNRELWAE